MNPIIQIEQRNVIGHACKVDVYIPLVEFSSLKMWHVGEG